MTFKKNFPPQFAQCVFHKNNIVASINGLDYDLILWLNYHCSYEWDMNKSLTTLVQYTDIKRDFKKTLNTNSVQASLKKIDSMEFEMNYLESYGSKTKQSYVPYSINILTCPTSKKSYGFEVTVDKGYISMFSNPSPKVTLEYSNTTILTQSTYKKLYLLLRDALGKNTSNVRIIDIDDLRHLLNVASATNTQVVNTIKKAIKVITANTNLQVTCIVEKKLIKSGSREIDKIRFRLYKQATPPATIVAAQIPQPIAPPPPQVTPTPLTTQVAVAPSDDEIEDTETTEQIDDEAQEEIDILFEEFVDVKVNLIASKRSDIRNIDDFKDGVKRKLMNNHQETINEFDVFYELICQKNELIDELPDNTNQYMIALTDPEDDTISYKVSQEYQVTDIYLKVIVKNVADILDFFDERYSEGFYWKIIRCNNVIKNKLMAF